MNEKMEIAVTGIGVVSPFGIGVSTFWKNLISNHSAVGPVTDNHLRQWAPVGARVPDFSPNDFLSKKLIKKTDRFTQLATGKSKRVGPRMISKCIPNAAASTI